MLSLTSCIMMFSNKDIPQSILGRIPQTGEGRLVGSPIAPPPPPCPHPRWASPDSWACCPATPPPPQTGNAATPLLGATSSPHVSLGAPPPEALGTRAVSVAGNFFHASRGR